MNECKALRLIRLARAELREQATNGQNSRELALVITKLDEAELWRERDIQMKGPNATAPAQQA